MKRSNLITPQGATKLRNELSDLWKNQRPEVTKAITAAAAEGDRSENAEYIYRKKQLRAMDWRIRYLQKRTSEMRVVETLPPDQSRIFFGALVHLEKENGDTVVHRIVGSDEFSFEDEFISVDSPLAKALIKKQVDDEVTIKLPTGNRTFFINRIEYPAL